MATQLQDTSIDVLINNAGVYGDNQGRGFGQLDYQAWTKTLAVNVQAPVKMAEAFLPHLKRGNRKLLVAISSLMGSMAIIAAGAVLFTVPVKRR
jgi:short-subunit dehydrogenase